MDYSNIKHAFLSQKGKLKAMQIASAKLGRDLREDEVKGLISHMVGKDYRFFERHNNLESAFQAVAAELVRNIKTQQIGRRVNARTYVDDDDYSSSEEERSDPDESIQELLKGDIYSTSETNASRSRLDLDWNRKNAQLGEPSDVSELMKILPKQHTRAFMGYNNMFDLVNLANPEALVKSYPTITLDSRRRELADPDPSSRPTIRWSFYNDSRIEQGSFNGLGTIRDIVSIEPGTIYFPKDEAENLVNEYNQVSMYIHEFSEQASIINEKVRYHFLFNIENAALNATGSLERVKLVPAFEDNATTYLDRPITTLNKLTISFAAPAERVSFGYDRDTNVTSITAANPAVITTSITHGLSSGDLVYFEDFTTAAPAVDGAIIATMNREEGHIITVTGATTFTVAVNTSSTTTPDVTNIFFGSRRIFIPLKFRYIGSKKYDDNNF